MYLEQDYERLEDGTRIKTKDDAIIEFRIMPATQGLYARRMTTYDKFTFTPPMICRFMILRVGRK